MISKTIASRYIYVMFSLSRFILHWKVNGMYSGWIRTWIRNRVGDYGAGQPRKCRYPDKEQQKRRPWLSPTWSSLKQILISVVTYAGLEVRFRYNNGVSKMYQQTAGLYEKKKRTVELIVILALVCNCNPASQSDRLNKLKVMFQVSKAMVSIINAYACPTVIFSCSIMVCVRVLNS